MPSAITIRVRARDLTVLQRAFQNHDELGHLIL